MVVLLSGCSVVRINTKDIDSILNAVLTKSNKLYNQVGQGYKYYVPAGVTFIDNDEHNNILYCNGSYYYLYIDVIDYYYKTKIDYKEKDRFVLCCDGVWNTQPEADIINMLSTNDDLETTIMSTRSLVEKIGIENGGQHDNHTMIVVDMKTNSKYRKSFFAKFTNLFRKNV